MLPPPPPKLDIMEVKGVDDLVKYIEGDAANAKRLVCVTPSTLAQTAAPLAVTSAAVSQQSAKAAKRQRRKQRKVSLMLFV